jgi:sulfur relay (sulfurtransferase) DsrC/TusE family protein
MGWYKKEKRYGGEDYMARRQRLYNERMAEEQAKKEAYERLSSFQKAIRHVKDYFIKLKTIYICAIVIMTTSYICDESGEVTILTCLGCMALFSMLMTSIYIAAKKKML